ncbi:MAG: EAL domain-containing protein [Acidobacteria bacterium]|nr:EAL domain-containing protein [Acidobacteriota bacterium]
MTFASGLAVPLPAVSPPHPMSRSKKENTTDDKCCEHEQQILGLLESEARYRLLFDRNPCPMWVHDAETLKFLAVNDAAVALYGFTRKEFTELSITDIRPGEEVKDLMDFIAASGTEAEVSRHARHMKKDGTVFDVEISALAISFEGRDARLGIVTDVTDRKRAEERLLHNAFHDPLTGLANRMLFMDHLKRAVNHDKSRKGRPFAVLYLDFDRFKVINDSLGHAEGDHLLQYIARRLENCTRAGDLIARLGGDEFAILVSELADTAEALLIAERIQNDLKTSFDLGGREIFTSTSIGIALSTSCPKSADEMLRAADIAMYTAKSKGKAQYAIFDTAMHKHASRRLQIETEMRAAMEQGQFSVVYQPILSLQTGALFGFEALVRWLHPERGLIPPEEFIPVAEENGLIMKLGQMVIDQSCRQLCDWRSKIGAASDLVMSVNLSSKEFLQLDLAEKIAAKLRETGLDPRSLKLEITESHIMENTELAVAILGKLQELGIDICLDDFGTGYSSLSYLHRLPVHYLKIDRSFIRRMVQSEEHREIVNTIVRLAQNLKMKVVAEGIENTDQLIELSKLNCEYGQGYYFSKPLSAREAKAFIAERGKGDAKGIVPFAAEEHMGMTM